MESADASVRPMALSFRLPALSCLANRPSTIRFVGPPPPQASCECSPAKRTSRTFLSSSRLRMTHLRASHPSTGHLK